jgi:hypothetical protein
VTLAASLDGLYVRVHHRDLVAEPWSARADTSGVCGRLPLAVCVAAARIAVQPETVIADFHVLLLDERRRLDQLAVGDLDVRASIALSYRALDSRLRLLRRLGLVEAPDWPESVAAELLGEAADGIDGWSDVHLVEPLGPDPVGQCLLPPARPRGGVRAQKAAAERMLSGWLALASAADESAGTG